MDKQDQVDFTVAVLKSLSTNAHDRLEYGRILRQKMHDQIVRGEEPTGYRAEWLKSVAVDLIGRLGAAAHEFDNSHVNDKASVADLLDILATAMNLLENVE